jgi:protein SCO1
MSGKWMLRAWLAATVLAMALPRGAWGTEGPRFTRDQVNVTIPDVALVDQRGELVSLRKAMTSDRPVFVEFIFATCTTTCPILSAGYASLQRKLDNPDAVDLISITIDPEHDVPAELRKYLDRYHARPGWEFLTGTRAEIEQVMRAFDAFVPDKMSHRPLTFVRSPRNGEWVRLRGFAGSNDLLAEYYRALGQAAERDEVRP